MGKSVEEFACTQQSCWMCIGDHCKLLTERCAGDSGCKFKKTQDQVDAGRRQAHERLAEMGERGHHLIAKFEHNRYRARSW